MQQKGNLFWGMILILGGVIFLLNTMGFFQGVNIWGLIWPLFLILLGAWILLGRLFGGEGSSDAVVVLDGAARGRINIKHGAGRLQVNPGAGPANLLEGTFVGGIDLQTSHSGELIDTQLSVHPQSFPRFGHSSLDWNIRINPQTPLTLILQTGAGETVLNLTDLQIQDLRLQTGASPPASGCQSGLALRTFMSNRGRHR